MEMFIVQDTDKKSDPISCQETWLSHWHWSYFKFCRNFNIDPNLIFLDNRYLPVFYPVCCGDHWYFCIKEQSELKSTVNQTGKMKDFYI